MGCGFEGGESRDLTHLQSQLAVCQILKGVQVGGEPFVSPAPTAEARAPSPDSGGLVGKHHPLSQVQQEEHGASP